MNGGEARSVRAPPGRGWRPLGAGAAVSLALHAGGLAAVLGIPLRAHEPEEIVVEVVWEAATSELGEMRPEAQPAPPQPRTSPPPEPVTPQVAEAEPPPEPERLEETQPEPAPSPGDIASAEPTVASLPPPPAMKPRRRIEPAAVEARPGPSAPQPTDPPLATAAPTQPSANAIVSGPSASARQEEEYVRTLLRWLEPHRRYPRAARLRGVEGEVRVGLTIDKAGSIRDVRVVQSSGARILDSAALDMIARAAPAPPLPPHMPAAQAEFVIPLRFALADR